MKPQVLLSPLLIHEYFCLHPDKLLHTGSDWCRICYCEDLRSAPTLKLECGHMFHASCIKKQVDSGTTQSSINIQHLNLQLKGRWSSSYISFGFLMCPLCSAPIKHEWLREELQPLEDLYESVRSKVHLPDDFRVILKATNIPRLSNDSNISN